MNNKSNTSTIVAIDSKVIKVEEYLRYEFSEDELKELAKSLAFNVQRHTQTQEEQKASASQFKEKLEGFNVAIGKLSRHINNGWEMRNVKCQVFYHLPVQGTKRIVRVDTGEVVREEAMSSREMQEELFVN